jgi:hypothetical protein
MQLAMKAPETGPSSLEQPASRVQMGPIMIFDKSPLQSLNMDEAVRRMHAA